MLTTALTTLTITSITNSSRACALALASDATGLAPEQFILEVLHQRFAGLRIPDGALRVGLLASGRELHEGPAGTVRFAGDLEVLLTALMWDTDHPLAPGLGKNHLATSVYQTRRATRRAQDARREHRLAEGLGGTSHELARRLRGYTYAAEAELVAARRDLTRALEHAATAAGATRPFDPLSALATAPGWSVQIRKDRSSDVKQYHVKGVGLGELLVSLELPSTAQVRFTSLLSPYLTAFENLSSGARNPDGVLQSELGWEDAADLLSRQVIR